MYEGLCSELIDYFFYASNYITQDNVIDEDEMCALWVLIVAALEVNNIAENCTEAMRYFDRYPTDGVISGMENLGYAATSFELYLDKTLQLDCSSCFDNPSDYWNGHDPIKLKQQCLYSALFTKGPCYFNATL